GPRPPEKVIEYPPRCAPPHRQIRRQQEEVAEKAPQPRRRLFPGPVPGKESERNEQYRQRHEDSPCLAQPHLPVAQLSRSENGGGVSQQNPMLPGGGGVVPVRPHQRDRRPEQNEDSQCEDPLDVLFLKKAV